MKFSPGTSPRLQVVEAFVSNAWAQCSPRRAPLHLSPLSHSRSFAPARRSRLLRRSGCEGWIGGGGLFAGSPHLPKSVSGPENPRPFTAVKARRAHGALRASHLPLGEFLVQDRGAFPTDFFFTSGLSTTILRPSILDTRVLEPHRQSVRFSHQPSPRLRLAGTGRISFASCLAVVEAFVSNVWLTMIRCSLAVRSLCQAPTQITLFTFSPGHRRAASAVELALGGDALPQKSPNRCVGRPPQGAGNNISLTGTTAHTAWACPLA